MPSLEGKQGFLWNSNKGQEQKKTKTKIKITK